MLPHGCESGLKTKKRGSRERSSPPCQIRILILPRCPEARGNIDLDRNTDLESLCRLPKPRGAQTLRIASAHHQTVFKPPFMTASALPLDFMTVESSTRWLPGRPKPSAQSQGGCAASGLTTGQQPQSFGRRPNGGRAL
jgi:hypothetical protein